MDLSIIIVSYNVKYFLEHCLLSVTEACKNIRAEIVVIDNKSDDGSIAFLQPKFPAVVFIQNEQNEGFAKANNKALRHVSGDHIVFLNPDTIVAEDCFEKCLSFFRANEDCGALGVRMIDGNGKFLRESKRALPDFSSAFFKSTGLAKIFPSSPFFAKYYATQLPEKDINKTAVLAGAFMMLSRRAIHLTQGFDEDFFMYGEDVDLSFRITKAGLFSYYFPDTTIIHFKGESTQKNSHAYRKHFYGSMELFAKKHFGAQQAKYLLTLGGIKLAKAAAFFNAKLSRQKKLPQGIMKVIVAGTIEEYVLVTEILKKYPEYLVQQPEHDPLLLKNVSKAETDAIVLCKGKLNYKEIIELAEDIAETCELFFYAEGASGIVGSSNKDKAGIVIAKS